MIVLEADRQPSSWDLWNDVTNHLEGDPYAAMLMIDRAVTRHLHEQTNSPALIANDAKQIHLYIPLPLDGTIAPTDSVRLTPHQEALLPTLRASIGDVLPHDLHAQTDTIAAHAASQIPSQTEVTAAFQRTTVADAVREAGSNQDAPALRAEPAPTASTTLIEAAQTTRPVEAIAAQAEDPAPGLAKAYYVEPTASEPGQVVAEFNVPTKPTPGKPLIEDATRVLVDAGTDDVAGTIESLATDHLRTATGTSARIHDDGTIISIRAQLHTDSSTAQADGPTLNEAQNAALSGIEQAVRDALPSQEQAHAGDVAIRIAKELPAQEEVIDAYNRPTLTEVLEHHQQQFGPSLVQPLAATMPKAWQAYQRSFPTQPSAALAATTTTAEATTNNTSPVAHRQAGQER
jgi:hypothetical protein